MLLGVGWERMSRILCPDGCCGGTVPAIDRLKRTDGRMLMVRIEE
jgi:hypothetical protein